MASDDGRPRIRIDNRCIRLRRHNWLQDDFSSESFAERLYICFDQFLTNRRALSENNRLSGEHGVADRVSTCWLRSYRIASLLSVGPYFRLGRGFKIAES